MRICLSVTADKSICQVPAGLSGEFEKSRSLCWLKSVVGSINVNFRFFREVQL